MDCLLCILHAIPISLSLIDHCNYPGLVDYKELETLIKLAFKWIKDDKPDVC